MDNTKNPAAGKKRRVVTSRQRPNTITRFIGEMDRPFLLIVLILVCFGAITLFSASYAFSAHYYKDPYYLARPQLRYALIGIAAMLGIAWAGPFVLQVVQKGAFWIYLVALGINALVPFIGVSLGGATRWIVIFGVQFQPSELLKFALVLICSRHIVQNRDRMHTLRYGMVPLLIYGGFAIVTTILQKHLSGSLICFAIVFAMMWLGGVGAKYFGAMTAAVVAVGISVMTFAQSILEKLNLDHVLIRLKVWKDPFSYMSVASGGKGWQPVQSLYAISSGGFWGLGLGQSNQKHGYLPEPYNDYIFAILCEEMGFFGAVLVIGLFAVFAWRGFHIATHSQDKFSSLMVMGIVAHVVIQVILNLAVVTNSVPSTGISMPFFSSGGTSLIILLCEMGLVLAVSRYSYTEKG